VAQPTVKVTPPAPVPAKIHKDKQDKFIDILKTDHNYDIIDEIVNHIKELKRAKKIKPVEKHRMVIQYHAMLLPFCLVKVKPAEEDTGAGGGKGVVFHISIGGDNGPADPRNAGSGKVRKDKKKGVSISIPTQKNKDGTYTVNSDPTD
jgi:hypothetical protein